MARSPIWVTHQGRNKFNFLFSLSEYQLDRLCKITQGDEDKAAALKINEHNNKIIKANLVFASLVSSDAGPLPQKRSSAGNLGGMLNALHCHLIPQMET